MTTATRSPIKRPDRCAICGRRLRDDTRVSRPSRPDICAVCYLHEEDEEAS